MSRLKSSQTRRSFVSDLHMLYRWGVRRGYFTGDPTDGVDVPRVPMRLPTPLTDDQLRQALGCDGRTRLVVMLGAYAGLRVSEIARLDGGDIDVNHRTIVVRSGKGGKDRVIPMAPELVDVLAGVAGPVVGVGAARVSEIIRQRFRVCGIDRRPHDLRATFATAAARACGGNLEVVAALLGHASTTTTRRYAAFVPSTAGAVQDLYPLAA